MNKEPVVVLGVSTFGSIDSPTYIDHIKLATSGLVSGICVAEGALLPLSRNICVANCFQEYPNFTHLFLVDSDVTNLKPELLKALVECDKDVVSAIYPTRQPPFFPVCYETHYPALFKELEKPQAERGLIETTGVATGCTVIKREVLEALAPDWFNLDRRPRETFVDELNKLLEDNQHLDKLELFKIGVKAGLNAHHGTSIVGEDYNFSEKATRMGFKCYLHSGFYVGHTGRVTYDLRDWLEFIQMSKPELRLNFRSLIWKEGERGRTIQGTSETNPIASSPNTPRILRD